MPFLTPTLPAMKFNETCKLTFPENVPWIWMKWEGTKENESKMHFNQTIIKTAF